MTKSKSKTFPKGTDIYEIGDFIYEEIPTSLVKGNASAYNAIKSKVLITITKYPDKEKEV